MALAGRAEMPATDPVCANQKHAVSVTLHAA
jgi:hypothetical protein